MGDAALYGDRKPVVLPMPMSTNVGILSVAVIAGLTLGIVVVIHRCRQRDRMLRALVESFQKPLLFYNEYGRLVFHSSGLVLFEKKSSLKAIKHPPAQPTKNQSQVGEMIIDHNRYRFLAKQFEYAPGKVGTLVHLEYQGAATANG